MNGNLTWTRLRDAGIDLTEWERVDFDGTFDGTVDVKTWGRNRLTGAIVVFMTLDDGRRVRFAAWQRNHDYNGFKDIPVGTRVRVSFARTRNGYHGVTAVDALDTADAPLEEGTGR